jgi:hypothetical protein
VTGVQTCALPIYAIFKFLEPLLGSTNEYWNAEVLKKVRSQRVPLWSLQFSPDTDCNKYLQRIWVALVPYKLNLSPDVVYLPQSPSMMLQYSVPSIAQKINALSKDHSGHIDDFSPIMSLLRFACNLVLTLQLQGVVSRTVLDSMGLSREKYESHIVALLQDFSAQEFNGEIARFLHSAYNGFPQIAGLAGAWRAKREAALLTRVPKAAFHGSHYASTFLRMLIRAALLCASFAMFFIFFKLCRAPRECRSIVKAIKAE